jgi:hypothetical protein
MEMPEVFLIEDNPADVLLTRQALSKYPIPLKIRVAKDGEQALITLTAPDCKPNLIILEAEVQRALALGAREYVKKPIGFRPFVDAVSGILDRWLGR